MDSSSPLALAARADLESVIRRVIEELLEQPVTPHVRELRAKAVTYGRVINNWSTYPPTIPQLEAMQECVNELASKVSDVRKREVSQVGRRPSNPAMRKVQPSELPLPPNPWSHAPAVTGVRGRTQSSEAESLKQPSPWSGTRTAPTLKPPASSAPDPQSTSAPPPMSAPRTTIDTPTPALLRSRHSR